MPSFLPALQDKEGLECLRFNGNLTADQSEELVKLSGLRELTIDSCSWNVVDVFPRWMDILRPTLMSLTLNVSLCGTHISSYVLKLPIVDTYPQHGDAGHHFAELTAFDASPCNKLH